MDKAALAAVAESLKYAWGPSLPPSSRHLSGCTGLVIQPLKQTPLMQAPLEQPLLKEKAMIDPSLLALLAKGQTKPERLSILQKEILGDCTRCKLCHTRQNIVFGEGSPEAKVMFVGEAPGADEDAQGRPFVGRAGQLLTKMIEAMGLSREQVYIANVIKCRPPENRSPEPDEIQACIPFLQAQIDVIKPKVIVALGKHAFLALVTTPLTISQARGQWLSYQGVALMPTFHPAFLLRNPPKKREVWEDLKKVMERLASE